MELETAGVALTARVELLPQANSPLSIVAAHPDLFGPFMELLVEVGADTI